MRWRWQDGGRNDADLTINAIGIRNLVPVDVGQDDVGDDQWILAVLSSGCDIDLARVQHGPVWDRYDDQGI